MATVCRGELGQKTRPRGGVRQETHVSLLHAKRLEDVGGLADLLEELLVGDLDVLSGLISLPDDGGLANELISDGRSGAERCAGLTLLGCLYAQRSTQLYETFKPPSGNHWTSPASNEPAITVV